MNEQEQASKVNRKGHTAPYSPAAIEAAEANSDKVELRTMLLVAQETLVEGLEQVEEALAYAQEEDIDLGDEFSVSYLEAYLVASLRNWILGGNPYDGTLDRVIGSLS